MQLRPRVWPTPSPRRGRTSGRRSGSVDPPAAEWLAAAVGSGDAVLVMGSGPCTDRDRIARTARRERPPMTLDHAAAADLSERYGQAWETFDGDAWTDLFTTTSSIGGSVRAGDRGAQCRSGVPARGSERQQDVEFTVERHWVFAPTVLAAWHASYVQRSDRPASVGGLLDDGDRGRRADRPVPWWWHRRASTATR